jgi:hypothetical protein
VIKLQIFLLIRIQRVRFALYQFKLVRNIISNGAKRSKIQNLGRLGPEQASFTNFELVRPLPVAGLRIFFWIRIQHGLITLYQFESVRNLVSNPPKRSTLPDNAAFGCTAA